MEQRERADSDWDHLEGEEAYLPGNDAPGREELPPSLDYTPTVPKRVEEHELVARGRVTARIDRDPLRILALGLGGSGHDKGNGKASKSELADIVEILKHEEER